MPTTSRLGTSWRRLWSLLSARRIVGAPAARPPAQQPPRGSSRPPAPPPACRQRRTAASSGRNSRRRASAAASTSSASTPSSPTGKGNPVLDLKQDDFGFREDNKPQKIESFSVVKIDDRSRRARRPPPRRSARSSTRSARRAAGRPALRHPARRLPRAPRQRHGRAQAAHRLHPEPARAGGHGRDHVSADAGDRPHVHPQPRRLLSAIEQFEGRQFDYKPRNEFEEQYAYYPAATVEHIRNQVMMGALKGAAIRLGGLREGRKSIIFVSEGFTDHPAAAVERSGRRDAGHRQPGAAARPAQNSDRAEFAASSNMISRHEPHLHGDEPEQHVDLRRRSARPGAVRVRHQPGRRPADRPQAPELALDTLRVLADNTDGRAIVNRNDLARA